LPYSLDIATGQVDGARQVPSPNHDERPAAAGIEVMVIHSISLPPGVFGGPEIEDFFQNRLDHAAHPFFAGIRDLRVSAHFLVRRDGELVQFVPVLRRAWHAGKSCCLGRDAVNDFSIGIELEGCDEQSFTEAQYITLEALTAALLAAIPALSAERVYGHADISPGRKTDPGPYFDWERYRLALQVMSQHRYA